MLSPRELVREASIIIARLQKQKAWIERYGSSFENEKTWIIVTSQTTGRAKAKKPPLAGEVVEAMCSKNWLSADPAGALRVTAAGLKKFVKTPENQNFADQHQRRTERLIKDPQNRTVAVQSNETESPLGWMRARTDKAGKPLLNEVQFEAGERIRQDFTKAQMSARVTSSWEFTSPAGKKGAGFGQDTMEISERAYAAKQRFLAALDHLGPELSGIVCEICCLASGLEAAERQLGWPRRSAKLVLTIALTKLSEHYGFALSKENANIKQYGSGIIKNWGREGYRPHIPPAQQS